MIEKLREIQARHTFLEIDEKSIQKANTRAFRLGRKNKHDLTLEDSASIGFAIIEPYYQEKSGINQGDNVGIFVTGRGLYATPSWEIERMKVDGRRKRLKEVAYIALGFVALRLIGYGTGYLADMMQSESQEKSNYFFAAKKKQIQEIRGYDNTMETAIDDVLKSEFEGGRGYAIGFLARSDLAVPSEALDKIILKYIELNGEKIKNAMDTRDRIIFENLKALVWESQQLQRK